MAGALPSIAGLGLVLRSLIEAPVRGWSSGLALGAGLGGLAVLAGFAAWDRTWQLSAVTVSSTDTITVADVILLGVGPGLVIPCATASVMSSLPREHTGVGSATNGALLQIGGALGVAVIGSLTATRYQDHITATLAPYHLPPAALATIVGCVGGALGIAAHADGALGAALAHLARTASGQGARRPREHLQLAFGQIGEQQEP